MVTQQLQGRAYMCILHVGVCTWADMACHAWRWTHNSGIAHNVVQTTPHAFQAYLTRILVFAIDLHSLHGTHAGQCGVELPMIPHLADVHFGVVECCPLALMHSESPSGFQRHLSSQATHKILKKSSQQNEA